METPVRRDTGSWIATSSPVYGVVTTVRVACVCDLLLSSHVRPEWATAAAGLYHLLALTPPFLLSPTYRDLAGARSCRHGGAPPRTDVPETEKEAKQKKTKKTLPPPSFPGGGPRLRPRPCSISCGGPWPPLLPVHLILFPFVLSTPAPRRDSDQLSYPRFTEEGQNCFGRSFVFEEQGHPGSSWMFPPTAFPHFFPELLDLGPPGRTVHEEMVAGLPLVPAAPPAPV